MRMITQNELETLIRFNAPVHIIDVRKKPAVEKNPSKITGAVWQDFQDVASWADSVSDGRTIICYCVHGHEVSQSATAQLCAKNMNAYYLQGGFEAWQERSGPLSL
jgi:rhodanese-related sulfurtransferase